MSESEELSRAMKELTEHLRYMGENTQYASAGARTLGDSATEAAKADDEGKKIKEAADKRLTAATNDAIRSVASFGKALTTGSEGGFSKFNDGLMSGASAVATLAKGFGPLGTVLSGLVMVGTKLLTLQMKQADDVLNASDEIKKLGAAGQLSTKQITDMVHSAGLSIEQSKKFTDAMKRTSGGLIAFGGTIGESALTFGKMVAVTNEQREAFQRMGVSQEELMNQQADYVALQAMSGKSMSDQAKDAKSLQKASLEYSQNLLRLSDLTGKSADKVAEEQKAAMLEYEEIVATRVEDDKIRKLKKEGRNDEAAALQQEQEARKAYITQVTTELGKTAGLQVGKIARTGAFDSSTAGLASLGVTPEQVQKGFKGKTKEQAGLSAAEFTQSYKEQQGERAAQLATALQFGGEALGNQQGLDKESLSRTGATAGSNDVERYKKTLAATQGVADGKKEAGGVSATDPAELARNKVTTASVTVTRLWSEALAATNPLLNSFGDKLSMLSTALIAIGGIAGSVLVGKAAIGGAGKLAAGARGLLGSSASTVASTVPVGKNGKALAGAALKSHLKKQAATSALGNIAGSAGTGSSAGGSKVMSMIGDAGPALAKLGAGAGEGAAGFLKAFANPMVLVGATTLGASIAAMIATIGAGIAGASWIMGKALPTLMEGIKSFEQIDGSKLKDTGEGMVGLGKGLAVFGAGGAAAGIGGIISNMSEGITSFFGGKTPIDKMVAFSKLDINAPKVKENAEAFTAFSEAFAMGGVGQASAGLGNTISNITDGVGKLFGQKDIIEKFVDFSKLNIDAKKTKEMAEAFAAFSSGIKGNTATAAPAIKSTSASPTAGSATSRSMAAGPAGAKSAAEAKAIGAANPSAPLAMAGGGRGGAGGPGGASSAPDQGGAEKTAGASSATAPAAAKSSGSSASLSDKEVKDMIKRHEGVRNKPYKDSLGLWTVGVGHLIGDGKSLPDEWNRTFTDQEVQDLYDKDFAEHQQAAASIPGYDKFNSAGKGALTDLTFNMGPSWIKRFPTTAKSIAKGDGPASAAGLQDSKWYTQVGSRAQEIVGLMSAGGGISARDGGITDGPESGYPATLHGNEIITPLSANSILEQLGKTPATSEITNSSTSSTSETIKEIYSMNSDVMSMLADKMDEVISKLSDSNDTQSKLLMYSRV